MALADDVTARLGAQRLVELTNPGAPAAVTADAARLGFAVTDAQAEFQVRTGHAFDDTDATHVAAGVEGVVYYLHKRAGRVADQVARDARESWEGWLEALRLHEGSDRVEPTTNSNLTPSREDVSEGREVRPDFDPERFARLQLRPPV